MKGVIFVGLALSLAACALPPPQGSAGSGGVRKAPRAELARRAPQPIMRPVYDHVSDSIQEAFPALDPPVADEAIYGRGTRPDRVMRGRLPPAASVIAEDVPEAPRVERMAGASVPAPD